MELPDKIGEAWLFLIGYWEGEKRKENLGGELKASQIKSGFVGFLFFFLGSGCSSLVGGWNKDRVACTDAIATALETAVCIVIRVAKEEANCYPGK